MNTTTARSTTDVNNDLLALGGARRTPHLARLGALMALMAFAATGCVAASASSDAVDEEAVAAADDALYGSPNRYWSKSSDGITYIPVCWKVSGYETDKDYVRSAVESHWGGISSIKFTGWGTCTTAQLTGNVIRIALGDVTPSSAVGTSGYGVGMNLNFTYSSWNSYTNQNCNCPPYDAACAFHSKTYYGYNCDYCSGNHAYCNAVIGLHEFGHALGYYHEQTRPDNSNEEYCDEFQSGETTITGGDLLTSSYDTASIMNYCTEWDHSTPVISTGDIQGTNAAYGTKPNTLTHQVLIYSDFFYQGSVQALYPGSYDRSALKIGNDALSSLRVPSGWTVTLYQNSGFDGSSISVTSDTVDLNDRSFDNEASSIVVTGPSETFPVIYANNSYSGTAQTLRPGLYNVSDLTVGNDAASSVSIPSGWTVTLYADKDWGGSTLSLSSSASALSSYSFNDKTSSIRVEGPADRSPAMIFKNGSYQGTAQALWPGRYNIDDLDIGNDALSSLIVPSGWKVVLLKNSDFWGSRAEYTSSHTWSSSEDFNDETSSIVVEGP